MSEVWRQIEGYEGIYEVSDLGRIRSLARRTSRRKVCERFLCQTPNQTGYLRVGLYKDGRSKTVLVHLAVLKAFAGPRPAHAEGCHGPRGKTVNHLSNLRWDTRQENLNDQRGDGHPQAKLTSENVVEIHRLLASGIRNKAVSRLFNVSPSTITAISTGKSWSHIKKAA